MTRERAIERARKLRGLAHSTNPAEAAVAAARARAFMRRHGLVESDVAVDSVELFLDEHRDVHREELARLVARSRGCEARGRGRALYLRGPSAAARDARALYRALVDLALAHSSMPSTTAPPAAHRVWRACFWFGYVSAVRKRLLEWRPAPTPASTGGVDVNPKDFDERAHAAAESVLRDLEVLPPGAQLPLKERAHAAGGTAGWGAPLPEWSPPPKIRGLLPPPRPPDPPAPRTLPRVPPPDERHLIMPTWADEPAAPVPPPSARALEVEA